MFRHKAMRFLSMNFPGREGKHTVFNITTVLFSVKWNKTERPKTVLCFAYTVKSLFFSSWSLKPLINRSQITVPLFLTFCLYIIDNQKVLCICRRYVINTFTWSFRMPKALDSWLVWQDVDSGDICHAKWQAIDCRLSAT